MEIVKAKWKFQANKVLSRGCEGSHYDSGVDNDEKEGDMRTKRDVYDVGNAVQQNRRGTSWVLFLTELETVAPSRCRSSFMTCTRHITMLSFHIIAQDSFLRLKMSRGFSIQLLEF